MEKVNKELIEFVDIHRKSRCIKYKLSQPSGFKNFIRRKIYNEVLDDIVVDMWWSSNKYSKEYFLYKYPKYYIEDDKIYLYPHITITRASGKSNTIYFEDEDELDTWIERNISDINLIEI